LHLSNSKILAMLKTQFVLWMELESLAQESALKCLLAERVVMKVVVEAAVDQDEMIAAVVVVDVVTGRDPDLHEADHQHLNEIDVPVQNRAQNRVKDVKLLLKGSVHVLSLFFAGGTFLFYIFYNFHSSFSFSLIFHE